MGKDREDDAKVSKPLPLRHRATSWREGSRSGTYKFLALVPKALRKPRFSRRSPDFSHVREPFIKDRIASPWTNTLTSREYSESHSFAKRIE